MWTFLKKRHHRFYKNNPWHLVLDLSALLIIIILITCIIVWFFYRPKFSFFDYSTTTVNTWTQAPAELDFSLTNNKIKPGTDFDLKLDYKIGADDLDSVSLKLISLNGDYSLKPETYVLNSLKAGQSGEVNIPLKLSVRTGESYEINWQAQVEYKSKERIFKDFKLLPLLKILPDLKVSAKIYYNSPQGDQLGAGPLPPQVDLPTNYWVSLSALGISPNLENFTLSARLPQNVNLTDKQSLLAGNLKYDAANRRIIWAIPKFETETIAQAGFEIQFIPKAVQADKVVDLLTGLKYTAYDKLSATDLSGELKNLNTNLEFDNINKGQGQVGK